jgi:hypothetical protein
MQCQISSRSFPQSCHIFGSGAAKFKKCTKQAEKHLFFGWCRVVILLEGSCCFFFFDRNDWITLEIKSWPRHRGV